MMTGEDLAKARKALGLTQAQFGERLGMGRRSIADIETGTSPVRLIHSLALERLALALAIERAEPMLAPAGIRREALDLVTLIRGDTSA